MNLEPNSKGKTILDYLPDAIQKLKSKAQPEGVADNTPIEQTQVIDQKAIEKATETLKKYKEGKKNLEDRIVVEATSLGCNQQW